MLLFWARLMRPGASGASIWPTAPEIRPELTEHRRQATFKGMDVISIKPERRAQLEEYARRHGQDPETALDDVLASYLDSEREEYLEAVEGIREGYEDMKAGRLLPADEALETLCEKHGLPR
jgi:predicted transcriptional regulator